MRSRASLCRFLSCGREGGWLSCRRSRRWWRSLLIGINDAFGGREVGFFFLSCRFVFDVYRMDWVGNHWAYSRLVGVDDVNTIVDSLRSICKNVLSNDVLFCFVQMRRRRRRQSSTFHALSGYIVCNAISIATVNRNQQSLHKLTQSTTTQTVCCHYLPSSVDEDNR